MKNKRFKATLLSIVILTSLAVGGFVSNLESSDKREIVVAIIGALMVIIPISIGGDSLRKSES